MADKGTISIVLADSQYLIAEALKAIFAEQEKFGLIETTNNAYELNKILASKKPDILITDFTLMDFDSIHDLQNIKLQYQKMAIVVLTNAVNRIEFMELNKVGIKNIITKITDREEFLEAIEAASKGKKYYSSEILDLLIELHEKKNVVNEPNMLTTSEIEIVRLISEGLTTKAIAERKNISFHTVMTHRKNIFRKLGINNSSELLMYAMKAGIIDTLEYYI
jgi:DNA-binding NarL/FixJ family response regulator